jgi:methyl-accepting chemotaxis protein
MREERKKVWVDEFQTKLLWRTFSYWALYTLALWNLLFVWWLVQQDAGNPLDQFLEFSGQFYPALIAFAVAFPVLAYDAIKFSHRLVGPLYRFRKAMQSVAAGEPIRLIKLREGDFLTELRDDFNQMLEALQKKGIQAIKPADPLEDSQQRQPA